MRTCASSESCGCAGGRREFLRQSAMLVAGVVAGLGASARTASAFPVAEGGPVAASGHELSYPVPAADGATIDRDNGVVVVRLAGRAYAFNLSCPHENAAVRWKAALSRFECSRHDSIYSPAGVYTSGRATRNMDRFAIRTSGATLVVDVSALIQSDQQKARWEAASVPLP
jgi:Rieske Fe-S protein